MLTCTNRNERTWLRAVPERSLIWLARCVGTIVLFLTQTACSAAVIWTRRRARGQSSQPHRPHAAAIVWAYTRRRDGHDKLITWGLRRRPERGGARREDSTQRRTDRRQSKDHRLTAHQALVGRKTPAVDPALDPSTAAATDRAPCAGHWHSWLVWRQASTWRWTPTASLATTFGFGGRQSLVGPWAIDWSKRAWGRRPDCTFIKSWRALYPLRRKINREQVNSERERERKPCVDGRKRRH